MSHIESTHSPRYIVKPPEAYPGYASVRFFVLNRRLSGELNVRKGVETAVRRTCSAALAGAQQHSLDAGDSSISLFEKSPEHVEKSHRVPTYLRNRPFGS